MNPKPTILLGISSRDHRLTCRQALEGDRRQVYHILEAQSSAEMLSQCHPSPPDLMVIDGAWLIPDAAALLALLQPYYGAAALPVIVLADPTHNDWAIAALKLGAQDYLSTAELTEALLQRTVRGILTELHLQKQLRQALVSSYKTSTAADEPTWAFDNPSRELSDRASYSAPVDSPALAPALPPTDRDDATLLSDVLNKAIASIISFAMFDNGRTKYRYCSPGCESVFGYTAAEFTREPQLWALRVHPDDLQSATIPRRDQIVAETTGQVEYRFFHKDGSLRWISSTFTSHRDEQAHCWIVTTVDTDITQHKHIETALRNSEEKFRLIAETISQCFFLRSASSGKFLYVSPGYEQIWGQPCQVLYENPQAWLNRVHPDDLPATLASIAKQQTGQPVQREYRIIRPDGQIRWISAKIFPITDATGQLVQYAGVGEDISDRKQAEAELYRREQEFRALSENSPDLIARYDRELRHRYVNPVIEKVTGLPPQVFLGKTNQESGLPDAQAELWNQALEQVFATGQPQQIEFEFPSIDGIRYYQCRCVPEFAPSGGVTAVISISRDITEQKQAEQALRQRVAQEQGFNRVMQSIRQSLDLNRIFATATAEIAQLLCAECARVVRYWPERNCWVVIDEYRQHPDFPSAVGLEIADANNFIAERLKGLEVVQISNAKAIDDAANYQLAQLTPGAWLLVPLVVEQLVWGNLAILTAQVNHIWTKEQIELTQAVADQLAIAIQQSQLYQKTQQQAQREQSLNRVVQTIHQSLDLSTILASATREVTQLLPIEQASIVQYLPEQQCWKHVAVYRESADSPDGLGLEIPDQGNPFAERLKRLEVVQINDSRDIQDDINRNLAKDAPGAWLLVPVVVNGSLWGSFSMRTNQPNFAWHDEHVTLIRVLADQLAIAILQSNLYRQANLDLAERQRAEAALQELNQELEKRVQKRTAQLELINHQLKVEIMERRQAAIQLHASLKEKEVLLKEIHHRVKNNLQIVSSLLSLQASSIQDPQILEPFRESQRRVKTMALIHEHLYRSDNLAKIPFSKYVHSLAADLFQSYIPIGSTIQLHTQIDPVELEVDVAIPCGLIINELVSNAIKYAFKYAFPSEHSGQIKIWFRTDPATQSFILGVEDNGVGIPESLDVYNTHSLGLQVVCELTEQLRGTLLLERHTGTAFKITFPDPAVAG
ncbi:MAG TPA: PAS domain-containing protein [Chroococcidiopsis sp.]